MPFYTCSDTESQPVEGRVLGIASVKGTELLPQGPVRLRTEVLVCTGSSLWLLWCLERMGPLLALGRS